MNVVVCAVPECPDGILLAAEAGYKDEDRRLILAANRLEQLQPVHSGHPHVGEDDVRLEAAEHLEPEQAVGGDGGRVPLLLPR